MAMPPVFRVEPQFLSLAPQFLAQLENELCTAARLSRTWLQLHGSDIKKRQLLSDEMQKICDKKSSIEESLYWVYRFFKTEKLWSIYNEFGKEHRYSHTPLQSIIMTRWEDLKGYCHKLSSLPQNAAKVDDSKNGDGKPV